MDWQMNRKKVVKRLIWAAVLLAVAAAVVLVVLRSTDSKTLRDRYSTAPELTGRVSPDEKTALLQKGALRLYLEENMTVRVEDGDGNIWSTNGLGTDGQPTKGQFRLSYYTANAAFSQMDSQTDSVDRQQAEAFLQDETLYVRYRVGDYGKTADAVPNYIRNDRFEKLFLSRLSQADAEEMEGYYKYYAQEDAWRIRAKGRNNFERILLFMEQVGYTDEDLVRDNADGGITTQAQSKPWFTIVLAYRLTEQGLSVSIPAERIEFSADFPLYEVALLPNFGLLRQNAQGYVLLPDGSGALMRFSGDYTARTEYSIPVYGVDWSVASDTLSTGQYPYEQASLPVFGMKDGSAAYLAVVDGGATRAGIGFHQAGTYFRRNAVYTTFRMVNKDSIYLSGSDNSSKVIVFEAGLSEETCQVSYCFLPQDSGYVQMAQTYREMLQQQGLLTALEQDATVSLLLETIGGVRSRKNTLGISYTGVAAATTYEQNGRLAQQLLSGGVEDLDLKLIGWFNGGVYHDYAGNVRLERVLGGKKGWTELLSWANENGVGLYPDVDFQRIAEADWGFLPTLHSAFRLDSNEAKYSILSRALLLEKEDIGLTPSNLYLLAPRQYAAQTDSFMKAYADVSAGGLSLRSTYAYSDFADTQMLSRAETVQALQQQLQRLSGSLDLMVENGAQYTFAYTRKMSGVSIDSSHFRVADETVPFLQLVLHGSMKLYCAPINLASSARTTVLRAIEYGVLPCYQVTAEDSSILKNSEYSDNYASGFAGWEEDILETYARIHDALDGLISCAITDHRQVAPQVWATTYENGDTIYVNYADADARLGSVTVPAGSYCRERGTQP